MMDGFTAALKGKGKRQALSAIEADLKNVLLAWDHACTQQNIEAIGMSLEPLWRFYWDFGRRELREFEQAVTELRKGEISGARGIVLGRLLAPLGRSYGSRGDTVIAREMLEESLDLLQRLGAAKESLLPLLFLAEVQDSMEESDRLYRESLALARTVGDPWAAGHALVFLVGNARLTGNYEEAQQLGRQALEQFGHNGDRVGMAVAYSELSLLAVDMGRYEEALTQARESISVIRGFNRAIRTMGLFPLGLALYALGRYGEAEKQFRQSLSFLREFGREGPDMLFWLGEVAFGKGEVAHASQLYQEGLAGAAAFGDLYLVTLSQLSLGRVNVTQDRIVEAREYYQSALQAALQLKWRPLLFDCLVGMAELFAAEGEADKGAHLATLVLADPASRSMTKDRAERLLTRIEREPSVEEVDAVRQRSHKNDLVGLTAHLLQDLERS
jgi:tetratricopeptide (TPR) repeat protein